MSTHIAMSIYIHSYVLMCCHMYNNNHIYTHRDPYVAMYTDTYKYIYIYICIYIGSYIGMYTDIATTMYIAMAVCMHIYI